LDNLTVKTQNLCNNSNFFEINNDISSSLDNSSPKDGIDMNVDGENKLNQFEIAYFIKDVNDCNSISENKNETNKKSTVII
jgi:hypothetical protein